MTKYRDLMEKYEGLTLESDVLDPAFVSKAKAFEEKIKTNQLTDDEITAEDNELVEMFTKLHDFTEEDSEEIKEANRKANIALAKAEVAEAETIDALKALQGKFKELPEVITVIETKIKKIEAMAEKEEKSKREKFITDATAEINAAKYENLQAMGEKYKDHPELVKLVNKRHADEKPPDKPKLSETLRTKKEWSYSELKALGITPTGNDMTVEGVRLEKEYLFNVYSVRK